MLRLCPFCGKPIRPNEPTVELVIGSVHEKCKLMRERDFFQEKLSKIPQFPKISTSLRKMSNQIILMLENIISRGLHGKDHEEFCNELGIVSSIVMEFNLDWWLARYYIAQKNPIDRLISGLKGYPFVIPRMPSESQKSQNLLIKILQAVTDYSISSIDESFGLLREKTVPKPKEECVKELKELLTEFDKTIRTMLQKTEKDFQKYKKVLKEDYGLWLQQNLLKLNEYGLLSELSA